MLRNAVRPVARPSGAALLVALVMGLAACGDSPTVDPVADAGPDGANTLDASACPLGMQDDDTDGTCLPDCTGNDCSGNGTCAIVEGSATCTCSGLRGGELCEQVCSAAELTVASATSASPDDASKLVDGLETGFVDFECDPENPSSFCTFEGDCSTEGCVEGATIALDLGSTQSFVRLRYLSDFHTKRPKNYSLWVSDDPTVGPTNGATLVHTGVGQPAPRVCATGDSCASEDVPDACCPDGRSAPQDTRNVGNLYALYDIAEFPEATGRYVYFVAEDTYDAHEFMLFEIELFDASCP